MLFRSQVSTFPVLFALFFFAVFLLFDTAQAQQRDALSGRSGAGLAAQIEGRVLDGATGEPLPYATVGVWSEDDSTLVTGTVTAEDGTFEIERLRPGQYNVRISYTGYERQHIAGLTLGRGDREVLGEVHLAPDEAALDELVVAADREFMETRVDRTVYNVRDQGITAGGSVSEVLETLPSVEVDIDGNVSLRGNENVVIHINGRPSPVRGEFLAGFLQQLPVDMVERVEVLPNPSARYDAEGMSGIINIVMREDTELGLNGGLSASVGSNDNYNISGNLGLQRGAWTLNGQYGFRYGARLSEGLNYRENRFRDPLTYLEQESHGTSSRLSHMFRGGVDYQVAQHSTLSLSGMVGVRGSDNEGLNSYSEMDHLQNVTRRYDRENLSDQQGLNTDLRLSFERVPERGRNELSAQLRYNTSGNDNEQVYLEELLSASDEEVEEILDRQQTDRINDSQELSFQADLVRPVGEAMRLETGYKGSLDRLENTYYSESFDLEEEVFRPDVHLNNAFVYDELVHAGYGILSAELGALGLQGGLRAEYTRTNFDLTTTGETYENAYFGLFPSLHLNYEIEEGRNVRAGYTRRLRRPRTRMLNPFTTYEDPLNLRRGNPYLDPQYTNSFEVDFRQLTSWGTFTVTPYYRLSTNEIRRVTTMDDEGVSTTTFDNFATQDSYGLEVVSSLRLNSRIRGFLSFSGYRTVTDGTNVADDLRSDALGWSARGNTTVQLRDGLDMQFFVMYRAPMEVERGRTSGFSMTNLSLQQRVFNDRGRLGLRISDLFGSRGFLFEDDTENYYQRSQRSWDSRAIQISFRYTFGQRQRNRDREDMMDGDRPEELQDFGIQ